MFPRFLLLAAWGGCLLWLSLTPAPPQLPPVLWWDKLQHGAAFVVFTLLAGGAFVTVPSLARRCWGVAFLAAIAFGGLIEVLQALLTTTRRAEIGDLLADAVGAGIVCLLARMWRSWKFGAVPWLRAFLMAMLLLPGLTSPAMADGEPCCLASTIVEESLRLRDEALDLLKTPIDTDGYGLVGTLAVGGAVGLTYLFDEDIRDKVQGERGSTLDTAADIGSVVGNPLLHLGIAGAVYGGGVLAESPEWRETGAMLGEAAILADATSFILKQAIGRGRPFATGDKGSFRPFQFKSDYDSLPSMHTASSFAMASVLASESESMGTKALYYAAATFVGFSRIYEDKHWASDIILGAAIGELCGRVVTNRHASGAKLTILPITDGSSASVLLVGRW